MIEVWHQWTCDGCGETETYPIPCTPLSDVRNYLKTGGWKCKVGGLDYCPKCVKNGKAAKNDKSLGDIA
jgi:hypothetical protein